MMDLGGGLSPIMQPSRCRAWCSMLTAKFWAWVKLQEQERGCE